MKRRRFLGDSVELESARPNAVGALLGPRGTSFSLAWLASHRDRLRALMLGTSHVAVLVIFDRDGKTEVDRSEQEIDALRVIVNGPEVPPLISERMLDRATVALLDARPPVRLDHAAPILQARREARAVLNAALRGPR